MREHGGPFTHEMGSYILLLLRLWLNIIILIDDRNIGHSCGGVVQVHDSLYISSLLGIGVAHGIGGSPLQGRAGSVTTVLVLWVVVNAAAVHYFMSVTTHLYSII